MERKIDSALSSVPRNKKQQIICITAYFHQRCMCKKKTKKYARKNNFTFDDFFAENDHTGIGLFTGLG